MGAESGHKGFSNFYFVRSGATLVERPPFILEATSTGRRDYVGILTTKTTITEELFPWGERAKNVTVTKHRDFACGGGMPVKISEFVCQFS